MAGLLCLVVGNTAAQEPPRYHIEIRASGAEPLRERFTEPQLAVLAMLNRADTSVLDTLRELVVPSTWDVDDLARSPLPRDYAAAGTFPKLVVVHLPGQVLGAYERGRLVRWAPVSSGAQSQPTPSGVFHLNWRSTGRPSTIDPTWFLRWYFNFDNREGLAFHEYTLPGRPASHGCLRLLQPDAQWLFTWGEEWTMAADGSVARPGTPVLIVGTYDFDRGAPWRSLSWLEEPVELPANPVLR